VLTVAIARQHSKTRSATDYFQRVDEVTHNVTGSCGGLSGRLVRRPFAACRHVA
jgi:hypothetical protein